MNLALPQMAPARQSLDPEMPLVREWTTMSAPKRACCCFLVLFFGFFFFFLGGGGVVGGGGGGVGREG